MSSPTHQQTDSQFRIRERLARCSTQLAQVELLTLRYRRGIGGLPMGPTLQDGASAPQTDVTRATEGKRADRAFSLRSVRSLASPSEARLNERLARVLGQKRGPDAVIVGVLCAAVVFRPDRAGPPLLLGRRHHRPGSGSGLHRGQQST